MRALGSPMGLLDRLVGRAFQRLLIRRYAVDWVWPVDAASEADWAPISVEVAGRSLAALHGQADGRARGVVVCAPPITRASKGFFLTRGYGQALRSAGFDVLLFDFNGFGQSGYRGIGYDDDIVAVGLAAQRCSPGLPVGLLGVCFGATFGVLALTKPGHPFCAAVFESPYSGFAQVLTAMDQHVHRTRVYGLGAAFVRLIAPAFQRFNPMDRAEEIVSLDSALFVACGRDTVVAPSSVAALAQRLRRSASSAAGACEVWELTNGEHLRASEAPGYTDRVAEFFHASFDRARAVGNPVSA